MNPIVIAATGGSGTRVLVRILQEVGVWFGDPEEGLNGTLDSMFIQPFLHCWLLRYIMAGGLRNNLQLPNGARREMDDMFLHVLQRHIQAKPDVERWGWKNPRCMYMLPFFNHHCPDMRFVHLIRDGRDMAFSINQGQTAIVGPVMLNKQENMMHIPHRCALLWSRANCAVAVYGEEVLDRYHQLRFEDLCARPEKEISTLLSYLGLEGDATQLAELVTPPNTIGRYKEEVDGADDLWALEELAKHGLRRFGYVKER